MRSSSSNTPSASRRKKRGIPFFEHVAARAEKRSFCIKSTAQGEEAVLIVTADVQQKQRVARSARHELVNKVQRCLFAHGLAGRATGGRTLSICARAFSIHGGRRSLLPSSSIVSSAVNPGGSVAISKRIPPGSRK
jgi:hypothetical protein